MHCSIYYTVHHNWEWIVDEAIRSRLCGGCDKHICAAATKVKYSDLPSNRIRKVKATYALFRFDLVRNEGNTDRVIPIRVNSKAFEALDPKDQLQAVMKECNVDHCMPCTMLIPHDAVSLDSETNNKPSYPAMLKASLGSGGSGLYYVYSDHDVLEVLRSHKTRAERVDGFIDGLIKSYGQVPHWSLQSLVRPLRVKEQGNSKSQIRVYVVECNGQLYLYETFEV